MEALLGLFASGAGGGIFGGLLGLFKGIVDSRTQVKMEEVRLERDKLELEESDRQRDHQMSMLQAGGKIELDKAATEAEAAAEVANMEALGQAQMAEFTGLKTSSWIDSLRASVRPVLAYYFSAVFSAFLLWVFGKFRDSISPDQGALLLTDLVATLVFIVTSIISFYYVSRRNARTA